MSPRRKDVESFGQRLRQWREQHLMTQYDLAQTLAIQKDQVWRWEQDRQTPRIATLRKLASASGHSVQWWRTGEESTTPVPTIPTPPARTPTERLESVSDEVLDLMLNRLEQETKRRRRKEGSTSDKRKPRRKN